QVGVHGAERGRRVQLVPGSVRRRLPLRQPGLVRPAHRGPRLRVGPLVGTQDDGTVGEHHRPPRRVSAKQHDYRRRSSKRTSTVEPAAAVTTRSPSTISAFALANPDSVYGPPDSGATVYPPPRRSATWAGRNSRSPAGDETVSSRCARTLGRNTGSAPASNWMIGRASTSNPISAEPVSPGRHRVGTRGAPAVVPEACAARGYSDTSVKATSLGDRMRGTLS